MKFTISQGDVKREIEGPFSMCASREDFYMLLRVLKEVIGKPETVGSEARGWFRDNCVAGWIDVVELPAPFLSGSARPWKD